jgi:nitrite reductase/ring-hydroxylating ferredoxin subunit
MSALGLFTLARAGRRREDDRPAAWSMALEAAGMSLLTAGGWLGGTLVFRNQIGVDHRYANAGRYRLEAKGSAGDTIEAASADELKVGQMKLLRAGGRRIALARTEHGYAAFDDRCTHRGGPLSDGALVCDTVQCPWHGSQFDVITGRVKAGPATDAIVTYAVDERDGRVFVALDDRLRS